MIRELRNKIVELQAERTAIDAKVAAISTVIDLFEAKEEMENREALTPATLGNKPQMSKTPESSSPTQPEGKSLSLSEGEVSTANGHPEKISITQEVREVVQELEGRFKSQDVVQRIKAKYPWAEVPPTPVSTALGRMVKRGESIRVAKEGEGWEPNIYEKVSHDNAVQEN